MTGGAGTGPIVETVTGPVHGSEIRSALGHEHFFVDFLGPANSQYMDVVWGDVTAACLRNAEELRAQGVDLFVDWTNLGVGRNVLLLREVSRRTGLKILCATGVYKSLLPPRLATSSLAELAAHFFGELTKGTEGTPIRAAWIKIAASDNGPTKAETQIHRAAAMAGKSAGATIGLHSPTADAANAVVKTLEREGFDLRRFVWAHAQPCSSAEHLAMAARGAVVQFDAIGGASDENFHGPFDDDSMLDRIQVMVEAGFRDRVVVSTDASVVVHPQAKQYDRDNTYLHRTFAPKLRDRIGEAAAQTILRDNVVRAFRRGSRVR